MYNSKDIFRKRFKVNTRVAVAFTGPSGSGKTTLVEKVAKELIQTQKVAIIKNDPKDKAVFDVEGKDSDKFTKTGAEVVVTSPTRTTYFSQREKNLDEIVEMINDFDILLVEGLKTLPLPRLAVFRNKIDESYFSCSEAIAIDDTINIADYTIPDTIDILDLNNTGKIIDWIKHNAKDIS
jgi:molybdopterin-guanine dinucleotide biosynthesis protein B